MLFRGTLPQNPASDRDGLVHTVDRGGCHASGGDFKFRRRHWDWQVWRTVRYDPTTLRPYDSAICREG